jgi:hypothetical protein
VHVVGDGQVQLAVAIVVDEGAAGAPLLARTGDTCLLRNLLEGSIALVVEEAVFAIAGNVDVVESVVVIVSNAGTLSPVGFAWLGAEVVPGRLVPLTRKMSGQPSLS